MTEVTREQDVHCTLHDSYLAACIWCDTALRNFRQATGNVDSHDGDSAVGTEDHPERQALSDAVGMWVGKEREAAKHNGLVDYLLSHGWTQRSQPKVVTSVEEVDALPDGTRLIELAEIATVGRDDDGATLTHRGDEGMGVESFLPALVLDGEVNEKASTEAEDLAGALALALHDAHPMYPNTAGWRGGIGGSMMTQGCSFIDPPPGVEWTQYDLLSAPLRRFVETHPSFNLNESKARVKEEAMKQLGEKS